MSRGALLGPGVGVGVIVVGALLGALVGTSSSVLPWVVALSLGVILSALSVRHPTAVFRIGVFALVLLPPYVTNLPTSPPHPAVALFAALGVGLLIPQLAYGRPRGLHGTLRFTPIDAAAGLLLLALVANVLSGHRTRHDVEPFVLGWTIMYLTSRTLIARRIISVRGYFKTWVAAAGALTPFAIYEAATGHDLFRSLAFNPGPNSVWLNLQSGSTTRFGAHRVDASLGHPIAFAMFFASASLMALALGLTSEERRRSHWYAIALLLTGVQALALSRTGWLLLGVGLVLVLVAAAAVTGRSLLPVTLGGAIVTGIVVFVIPQTSNLLVGLGTNDTYRSTLITDAFHLHLFHFFGNRLTAFQGLVGSPLNPDPSIDNQYLLAADRWGYIGLFGLLAVAGGVAWGFFRLRRAGMPCMVTAVALASLAALGAVAFITQEQLIIWSLLGASAAVYGQHRSQSVSGE